MWASARGEPLERRWLNPRLAPGQLDGDHLDVAGKLGGPGRECGRAAAGERKADQAQRGARVGSRANDPGIGARHRRSGRRQLRAGSGAGCRAASVADRWVRQTPNSDAAASATVPALVTMNAVSERCAGVPDASWRTAKNALPMMPMPRRLPI